MSEFLTPRQRWLDALFEDAEVSSNQRLVAVAFYKFAADGTEDVWVARERAIELTQLSDASVRRATRALEERGWLTMVQKARQHHSARHALTAPRGVTVTGLREPSPVRQMGLTEPRPVTESPQTRHSDARTTKNNARARLSAAPTCQICNRTEAACRRAEARVPADERHEFISVAA